MHFGHSCPKCIYAVEMTHILWGFRSPKEEKSDAPVPGATLYQSYTADYGFGPKIREIAE